MPITLEKPMHIEAADGCELKGHRSAIHGLRSLKVLAAFTLVVTGSVCFEGQVLGQDTENNRLQKMFEVETPASTEAESETLETPATTAEEGKVRSVAFEAQEVPADQSLNYDEPLGQIPMPLEISDEPEEVVEEEIIEGLPSVLEPLPMEHPLKPRARSLSINPIGLQQGMANVAFNGDDPVPRQQLGFPASVLPMHWGKNLPRMSMQFSIPDQRHQGKGDPLVGTSWINRPLHVDLLSGGLFTGELVTGTANATNGILVGTRIGWDLNHYLGGEFRLAQADVGLQGNYDRADIRFYDVSVLYYPWGDSRLRPFTTFGLGISQFTFTDRHALPAKDTLMQMPFGIGFKYLARPNLSLRMEFLDNLAFGSTFMRTQNNLSLTGGMELRFGGQRRNYYPFSASSRIW